VNNLSGVSKILKELIGRLKKEGNRSAAKIYLENIEILRKFVERRVKMVVKYLYKNGFYQSL